MWRSGRVSDCKPGSLGSRPGCAAFDTFQLCRRSSTFVKGCQKSSIFIVKFSAGMSETFFNTCVNWSCVTRCGCRTTSSFFLQCTKCLFSVCCTLFLCSRYCSVHCAYITGAVHCVFFLRQVLYYVSLLFCRCCTLCLFSSAGAVHCVSYILQVLYTVSLIFCRCCAQCLLYSAGAVHCVSFILQVLCTVSLFF